MTIPEREIQAKLYRFLSNVIDKKFRFGDIEFTEVLFERPNIDGFPDLVVYASEKGKKPIPILVIETKRKVPYRTTRFDPWDRNVIAQAERYATWLGARDVIIPLKDFQNELDRILEIAKKKILQDREILKFLEGRRELAKGIDEILPRIENYIKKHYPIEKI